MNMTEFSSLIEENKELFHQYLQENLLSKDEAPKYTGQTQEVFDQSAKLNTVIKPFFFIEKNGRKQFKLYLKSELIEYGKTKRTLK